MSKRLITLVVGCLLFAASAWAQAPIEYRISFPSPEHRWMQVDVRFHEVPPGTLQVRKARTSPGRYALTEAAKNVFDVAITNGRCQALQAARPNLHQWDVLGHDGTVTVRYKIFGDRTDGTYLASACYICSRVRIPIAMRPRSRIGGGVGPHDSFIEDSTGVANDEW